MRSYVPNTESQAYSMLEAIGLKSMDELFVDIPREVKLKEQPRLNEPMSELELRRLFSSMQKGAGDLPLFRGAGAYRHYIPSVINAVVSRSEFYTAYTPYQAEMSQGMLQSIFEYQSLMARLTGMDVSNASVYDGATACAEALIMMRGAKRKNKILYSAGLNPEYIQTIKTYARFLGVELLEIPLDEQGRTDINSLKANSADSAGVLIQSPSFFGAVESLAPIADIMHENKALLCAVVNPLSLGLLKRPGDCEADIAVGEGQPLGMALSVGGPYLGFMCAKKPLMRNLPGRIVGRTNDSEGNHAYVLTLQAREQHIRREKAASNICSNQSLCAITAAVYLSAMGPYGLREAAYQCAQKAHYLRDGILCIPKMKQRYEDTPFFNEFVIQSDIPSDKLDASLREKGFIGGLPLSKYYKGDNAILYCATEVNSRQETDEFLNALEVCAK